MEPRDDFVTRHLEPDLERLCGWMADTVDACINYGSHVIAWLSDNPKGSYADATVAGLFRHFLEQLDGISVLVRHSCADAAKPLLRSALESSLGLEYILEADTINRGLAYQVAHAHRRIKFYRDMNPNTAEGVALRKKLANDSLASILQNADPVFLQQREDNLLNMLRKPEFVPIEQEWQTTKRRVGGKPNWFSLFGGPRSIEDLAGHLGRGMWYELLYRSWSESTHATSGFARVTRGAAGPTFYALRYPGDLQQVTTLAVELALELMKAIVYSYVPARKTDFAEWYVNEVKGPLQQLSGPRIINIVDSDQ